MNFKHKYSRILSIISRCFKENLITNEERSNIKEFFIRNESQVDLFMKENDALKIEAIALKLKCLIKKKSNGNNHGKRGSVHMEMPKKMLYILSNEGEIMRRSGNEYEMINDGFKKSRSEMKNNHTHIVESPINFTMLFHMFNEQYDDDKIEDKKDKKEKDNNNEEISDYEGEDFMEEFVFNFE